MLIYPISHFSSPPASGGDSTPDYSIDFEAGSSQYLSMSDANFGSYDKAKWAVSVWYKRESTGANMGIFCQDESAGQRAFNIIFNSTSKIRVRTYQDGTNVAGDIITTATYTDTSAYHHILFWYDSANATAGNRMRLWHDGTEVTVFDTDTNPTAAVHDSTGIVTVGAQGIPSNYFDGLLFQTAFFSGTLPAIGDVYDAGAPVDITGLTGLYAYLDVAGGSVVSDGVLSTDWTNNNTAVNSTTKP